METPAATPRSPETLLITAGRPTREPDSPLNVPVTFASNFVQGGVRGYARHSQPTWDAFEDVVGSLEGGRALAFASGLAALGAVLELVPPGGVVVAPDVGYSGTRTALDAQVAAGRLQARFVDTVSAQAMVEAVAGADLVWLETPTNPMLETVDIRACVDLAHASGALVAVDATFASPLRLQPLAHGADLAMHSATKIMSGHSDLLMGVVTTADLRLHEQLHAIRTRTGGVAGPMETWLALRGLRTLAVRLDRAEATARSLADRLSGHPAVGRVRYPGTGAMLAVELSDAAAADAVVDSVQLWVAATSLGGVESSLERRRRWAEESAQVPEGLLRLSVGLESPEDLWADLSAALDRVLP
ncbi:MAG: PLP-dependent aspartate aminotransferase family protein [Actinomycetes bacterium]